MFFVFLFAGIVIGALAVWVALRGQSAALTEQLKQSVSREALQQVEKQVALLEKKLSERQVEYETLVRDLATSEQMVENYSQRLRTRETELREMQDNLRMEFENLANRLLEEKSKRFTEQNQTNLGQLVRPLQERLAQFETTLNALRVEDAKARTSLTEQIRMLADLNSQMSDDARNLTRALKGDNKTQGNWGEMVLEKILEKSGLTKNREYVTQMSLFSETHDRKRMPDVVIHLPEGRHIIVDSKMSLVAYERYVASEDNIERNRWAQEHLLSVKTHVKQLSEKNYPALNNIQSPDFVLMFVPLEPAFALSLQTENELFVQALERNVIIVSPTTLLATLRTINSMWRQEHQNRNAQLIAEYGGHLYDKFCNFIADMEEISAKLSMAQRSHEAAMNKLAVGKGNLVSRAEKLKQLGAKASKQIPTKLIAEMEDEDALDTE